MRQRRGQRAQLRRKLRRIRLSEEKKEEQERAEDGLQAEDGLRAKLAATFERVEEAMRKEWNEEELERKKREQEQAEMAAPPKRRSSQKYAHIVSGEPVGARR